MSVKFEDYKPKTLNEAIEYLYSKLDKKEIEFIKENDPSSIHHFTGMHMRNGWGLWDLKTPLNKDIRERFNLFGHGDDCSGLIMDGLWAKVNGDDVDKTLEETAQRYREHWPKCGIDPKTGKEISGYKEEQNRTFTIKVEAPKKPKKPKK